MEYLKPIFYVGRLDVDTYSILDTLRVLFYPLSVAMVARITPGE
jgi:hypothetical protein